MTSRFLNLDRDGTLSANSDEIVPSQKAIKTYVDAHSTGGGTTWGNITGTLSDQTDLQSALDAKQDAISDLSTIRSGAAAGATALQNTATGTNALSILGNSSSVSQGINIGKGSSARAGAFTTAYGYSADAAAANSLAVGSYAQTTAANATAIGGSGTGTGRTSASGQFSVAVGSGAKATANNSAQIGEGTNSTASTLQFRNTTVVDANGKIPASNLDVAKQDVSNLVTSVSSSSTDSQYPSAKLFYDTCGNIEALINAL